jgi:hypothetical protein
VLTIGRIPKEAPVVTKCQLADSESDKISAAVRDVPNETMFFTPTTSTSAGPGLLGFASAAKCVVVMMHTMNPNWKSVHPCQKVRLHNHFILRRLFVFLLTYP